MFAKGYTPNQSEDVLVVSKIENIVPWTYVVSDLNGEEITGIFYKFLLLVKFKIQFLGLMLLVT